MREIIGFIQFIIVIVLILAIPVMLYHGIHIRLEREVVEFNSIKRSINQARNESNGIELAAMSHKIIEANIWLDTRLFTRNQFLGNYFTLDALDTLTHIK